MIRKLIAVFLAGLIGIAAASLVACGTSRQGQLLSPQEASRLVANLDKVNTRFANGNCDGAQNALATADIDVDSLAPRVDAQLKSRVRDGLERLRQLLQKQCKVTKTKTTATPTTTETVPTQTQQTTKTNTIPTVPTQTETQPPATVPTETTPPPSQGDTTGGGIETPPDAGGTPGTQ